MDSQLPKHADTEVRRTESVAAVESGQEIVDSVEIQELASVRELFSSTLLVDVGEVKSLVCRVAGGLVLEAIGTNGRFRFNGCVSNRIRHVVSPMGVLPDVRVCATVLKVADMASLQVGQELELLEMNEAIACLASQGVLRMYRGHSYSRWIDGGRVRTKVPAWYERQLDSINLGGFLCSHRWGPTVAYTDVGEIERAEYHRSGPALTVEVVGTKGDFEFDLCCAMSWSEIRDCRGLSLWNIRVAAFLIGLQDLNCKQHHIFDAFIDRLKDGDEIHLPTYEESWDIIRGCRDKGFLAIETIDEELLWVDEDGELVPEPNSFRRELALRLIYQTMDEHRETGCSSELLGLLWKMHFSPHSRELLVACNTWSFTPFDRICEGLECFLELSVGDGGQSISAVIKDPYKTIGFLAKDDVKRLAVTDLRSVRCVVVEAPKQGSECLWLRVSIPAYS